jgi:hypothetical protein
MRPRGNLRSRAPARASAPKTTAERRHGAAGLTRARRSVDPSTTFTSIAMMQFQHSGSPGAITNTDPNPAATCPRCGSSETIFTRCTEGLHYGKIRCLDCGRVAFAMAPWSLQRARSFTLYFGKYRGRQLGDLIETEDGRSYVRWLATRRDAGNAAVAARIMLEHLEHVVSTCSNVSPAHERARRLRNAGPSGESTVCAVGRETGSIALLGSATDDQS